MQTGFSGIRARRPLGVGGALFVALAPVVFMRLHIDRLVGEGESVLVEGIRCTPVAGAWTTNQSPSRLARPDARDAKNVDPVTFEAVSERWQVGDEI